MEINTNKLKYQDNDVVQLGEKLYKFAQIKPKIIQQLESITTSVNQNITNIIINCISNSGLISGNLRQELKKLLTEGIDYQILRTDKPGWRQGKLRIKYKITIEVEMEETEPDQPESPLDDIRQKM